MRQSLLCGVLGFIFASSAAGDFVGGGVVSLQAWNDAANATDLPTFAGGTVRVYRLFAAFDGQSLTKDTVNIAHSTNIHFSQSFVNVTNGFPTGEIFENPAVRWDSFATINIETIQDGLPAAGDSLYEFGPDHIAGAWFVAGSQQGQAGTRAGSDDYGTGLYLVMLAQITMLVDSPVLGDLVDIRTDGTLGSGGGVFQGELSLGINYQNASSIDDIPFVVPAPGGVLGLACFGLLARRRRA